MPPPPSDPLPTDLRADPRVPSHRRTIDLEVFDGVDDIEVVGRLRDERPWAGGTDIIEHVHDMELAVTVRRADVVITSARATMHQFPHAECPGIEAAFAGLVGLSVLRGYNRAIKERFGRNLGCSHLEVLARAIGPVVVQGISSSALRLTDSEKTAAALSEAGASWYADSCHIWATQGPGPGMQKLALGWRPGKGPHPIPSVEEIRRSLAAGEGDGAEPA